MTLPTPFAKKDISDTYRFLDLRRKMARSIIHDLDTAKTVLQKEVRPGGLTLTVTGEFFSGVTVSGTITHEAFAKAATRLAEAESVISDNLASLEKLVHKIESVRLESLSLTSLKDVRRFRFEISAASLSALQATDALLEELGRVPPEQRAVADVATVTQLESVNEVTERLNIVIDRSLAVRARVLDLI
ncbi:hypothetical protein [Amycolatopsis sp. WAC 04169]|uniref:hypothetical protein n=1 Tax=Amycolatopsis sp. WAC 04169 TaxID=2203197 RepID=UPI000F7A638A|nr:hypothetical protein [Amycolatopsis sp. WAC 04169]